MAKQALGGRSCQVDCLDQGLLSSGLQLSPDDPVRGLRCCSNITHSGQPFSLILLPIGDTTEDLLKDLNKKVSSSQLSLRSKKLVKLFLFLSARA